MACSAHSFLLVVVLCLSVNITCKHLCMPTHDGTRQSLASSLRHSPAPHSKQKSAHTAASPAPVEKVKYSPERVCSYGANLSSDQTEPTFSCASMPNITSLLKSRANFYTAYSPVIKKRKFVFVGESTMFHQYNSFCELFRGTIDSYEQYRIASDCVLPGLDASAHFFGFGVKSTWKWTQKADHLRKIAKAVEALGAGDVILASSGVHFTRVCRKVGWSIAGDSAATPPQLQFSDDKYEFYVQSLLSIVNPAGRGRCVQLQQSPILLWRDVLPQHFPSSNGQYDPSLHPNMTSPCAPMTEEVYLGQSRAHYSVDFGNGAQSAARLGQCEPNCLPANWQNEVVKSFLGEQCVPALRVFDEVACLHEHHVHKEGDCTHYSLLVHALLNERFLSQVSTSRGKLRPGAPR